MRIGINATWMTPGAAGGHEWYVRNLITQLAAIDADNQYVLFAGINNHRTFALPGPNWRMVVYDGDENAPHSYRTMPRSPAQGDADPQRGPRAHLRRLLHRLRGDGVSSAWRGRLASLVRQQSIDVWFCPFIYALPVDLDPCIPVVITMPDLQHEHYPGFFNDDDMAGRALGYQWSCRIATAVIAVSRFTADEIIRLYAVDSRRVFAIPLGLDESFAADRDQLQRAADHARRRYRLPDEFLYYPAAGWAHKNHQALVEAMAIARQQHNTPLQLVLTGWPFDVMDRLRPLLRRYRLHRNVRHLGYIKRTDQFALFAAARALVFPSLFEGFGLPLVEAMSLGLPIACSTAGSIREVCGDDAALYFDPHAPQQIADAIIRIHDDNALRERLARAGRCRAACFTYRRTAEQTLAVFEQIRAGRLRPPAPRPIRPLIPHRWLYDGHSQWHFRCPTLRCIDVEVLQPTRLRALSRQSIQVSLNSQIMLEARIPPRQPCRFHIAIDLAGTVPPDGLHELRIVASARHAVRRGDACSVQILRLTATDSEDRKLRLIR